MSVIFFVCHYHPLCMSLLSSVCHYYPLCISLLPSLYGTITLSLYHCYPFCMSLFPLCMSLLPSLYVTIILSVWHYYPLCMSLLPFLYVICVAVTLHTPVCGCHWLQCGDIADIRLAQKHIRGRACKFGYVEFQTKVGGNHILI